MANLANALVGFSGGIQGQLPQFLQQQQQAKMQDAAVAQQNQAAAQERMKTYFTDANAALKLLDSGNLQGVQMLGLQRLQLLKNFPDADPSDTQMIVQLANAAKNGSKEALTHLRNELQSTVEVGKAYGIIQPEKQSEIVPASSVVNGQVVTQSPTGQFTSQPIQGFQATPPEVPASFRAKQMQADAAGLQPGTPEYNRFMTQGEGTVVNVGSGSTEFDKLVDQQLAAALDAGSVSASAAPQLQMLEQLAPITTEGVIPAKISEMFPTYNDANTAYIGIVNQVLPSLRVPGSGAQSDRDIDVLQKSMGQLGASAETKILLVKAMQEKNNINQKLADIAQRYASGEIDRSQAVKLRREINSKTIVSPRLQDSLNKIQGVGGKTVDISGYSVVESP